MKNKKHILCVIFMSMAATILQAQESISLSGTWNFQNDKTITLPGTTDQAHYGEKTTGSDFGILTRAYKFIGTALYERDITIPEKWSDKRIYLDLERVLWESRVSIDGKEISCKDALNSVHRHDLGYLTPGNHKLSISVNNDMIYNIGDKGHVYSEYTQSIWNGIVGKIELTAVYKARLGNPQIFTKIAPCTIQVTDTLINEYAKNIKGKIKYELYNFKTGSLEFCKEEDIVLGSDRTPVNFVADMPATIKLWDDMSPNMYTLKMSLLSKDKILDTKEIEFGFREVSTSKSKILINGKPVFLRGNLDCIHFPLTGYPSCDVEEWQKIFRIYKDYGLNHVRFHSWCPPKAAFTAADREGIYIQAETIWIDYWMSSPNSRKEMDTKGYPQGLGKNPQADKYVKQELQNMVYHYGNHPSFVMMCIGNELGNSDFDVMNRWMQHYKDNDSRRLYSSSTARKIMPADQYMATHYIDKMGATRGLVGGAATDWDFENTYSKSDIPILSHEIGQWPVYPRWSEIKKYTGVLKARNLEGFREEAKKNNIENQNNQFVAASGALNVLMYKYEIESFLRTPSCGGIQLLSMQDYQGQGEALIGWLDVFYDSKGIVTPEKFRSYHDTTTTLLRMPRYVWSNNETFDASIQLAHYGSSDIKDGIYWIIKDSKSNIVDSGNIAEMVFKRGSSDIIANIRASLANVKKADKLTIEVGLNSRNINNSWNIWVYPLQRKPFTNDNIYITDKIDAKCEEVLSSGGSVLLDASTLGDETTMDKISFYPLYWSLTFFPGQGKNTLGMYIQDKHPLFLHFPTDYHSDWQWQHIYKGARAFYLNDYPADYRPIAQPIDDFHRNNKLGAIFEMKVGSGKMLVCGFDLKDKKNIVAGNLKKSIIEYMNSTEFSPSYTAEISKLKKQFVHVESLKNEMPKEFSNASLYVECAANLDVKEKNIEWDKKYDIVKGNKTIKYSVTSDGSYKDDLGAAWHGTDMSVNIKCPEGMIGTLYVLYRDWNNQGRTGSVNFEGRQYSLEKHTGEGIWIKLHVMREDANDGNLLLKSKVATGGNLMISKIILIEE